MCVRNPDLVVISGGPGSGKTTVLEQLQRLRFRVAPEVARQIIQEQVRVSGNALPWSDRTAYTRLMLERSIESYLAHAEADRPTVFDRGIPDTLGYAQLIGLTETASIQDACRRYRYSPFVFLAPPWEEIYKTDTERKQDFAEALQTFDQLGAVYRDCGYELIELPKSSPLARAEFILERLKLNV